MASVASTKVPQAKRGRCLVATLPQDLVVHIARRVVSWEDFIAFGKVCTSWRSAAVKENFTGGGSSTHQFPLVMSTSSGSVIFYSLATGKFYKRYLPEVGRESAYWSSLGWLMSQLDDRSIRLLHPFESTHIELPDNLIYKNYRCHGGGQEVNRGDLILQKFVLSSNPSTCRSGSEDCIVMVLYCSGRLAFCRPQDNGWTMIDASDDTRGGDKLKLCDDITYYQGQFYAVDRLGNILICDIKDPMQAKTRVVDLRHFDLRHSAQFHYFHPSAHTRTLHFYLVECAGSLLVVCRHVEHIGDYKAVTSGFRVFEVPLSNPNMKMKLELEVTNLGNRSLFVGYTNSSFSIDARSFAGCKSNCIYYSHAYFINKRPEVGIFHMEQRRVEPCVTNSPPAGGIPIAWVQPRF